MNAVFPPVLDFFLDGGVNLGALWLEDWVSSASPMGMLFGLTSFLANQAERQLPLTEAAMVSITWLLAGFLAGAITVLLAKGRQNHPKRKAPASLPSAPDPELLEEMEALREVNKRNQYQLRQQERFVTLGKLMAGIAHEVRNPLNFINNFAELSLEILSECRALIQENASSFNSEEKAEFETLLTHLEENAQRIQNHGERANNIVMRVLVQSREPKGQWRRVDINDLVEEYADLCFHSVRARRPGKKHNLVKELDRSLPKVVVDPQDFSRVILNLIHNGYYAAGKHGETMGPDFKPTVTVASRLAGDQVLIAVSDNGPGISPEMRDKIFNPFFTTKPLGEGTGLGLSLSKEIIDAHHGRLEVVDLEEGGTCFEIHLPMDPGKQARVLESTNEG